MRSSESRNDATMIAIAAIRAKLATIAARLTAACPGAPRSWATARTSDGVLNLKMPRNTPNSIGTSSTLPTSRQAMAA
jgi:hypothetical protein